MILIAESGSTKTDWRLIDKNEVRSFNTIGFNPYFIDSDSVLNELNLSELRLIKKEVTQVFFYGAGCSSKEHCDEIAKPLTTFFSQARIEVNHDLLAAARATCGIEQGMVAILGTGSNSCIYNGEVVTENVAALGYLLGDYGSGADIGKTFIKAYLNKELPKNMEEDFKQQFNLTNSQILEGVYKKALPNRFLASFSPFVYKYLDDPNIKKMVEERIHLFFKKNICRYTDYEKYELHLVGSIATVYQELIKRVLLSHNVSVGRVIKKPINELIEFHQIN